MMSYFDPGPSAWRYIVRMGLTSMIPTIVLTVAVSGIVAAFGGGLDDALPRIAEPTSPKEHVLRLFLVVVFSPVGETLLMSPTLWLLSRAAQHPVVLAVLNAAVWAGLHSLVAPAWGLHVAWPFYVFSRAYLAWRPLAVRLDIPLLRRGDTLAAMSVVRVSSGLARYTDGDGQTQTAPRVAVHHDGRLAAF